MAAASNPFFDSLIPMLWDAEIAMFGVQVSYTIEPEGVTVDPLTILLKEGTAGESMSPGRYAHAWVKHADLPRPPTVHDSLLWNGSVYDIASVDAQLMNISMLVIQKAR